MSAVNQRWSILVLGLALAFVALPAAANKYIVTLTNGAKFETLRQPSEAGWDRTMVMVLTDAGNWIAIRQEEIQDVTAEIEIKGFGKVIDSKTVQVGTSINDAPTEEEEAAQRDPMASFLEQLNQQQPQQRDYSVQQFVNPDDAGGGGLPASYGGGGGNSVSVFSFNQGGGGGGGGGSNPNGGDGGQ